MSANDKLSCWCFLVLFVCLFPSKECIYYPSFIQSMKCVPLLYEPQFQMRNPLLFEFVLPIDSMTLFLVVYKTFSTFHFQTLWCVLVWICLFYWFMQILESIGLSILPSWEILWHKFLFIVSFLCPFYLLFPELRW